jgi:flagellar basal body-associated protein FliL
MKVKALKMIKVETKHILRSATFLERALLLILLALLTAAVILIAWLGTDLQQAGKWFASSLGYEGAAQQAWQSSALGAVALTQITIWGIVVWYGKQIFTAIKAEDMQTASTSAGTVARLLWIMLIWGIVAQTLGTLIATWHFPEGQRALSISFGSPQISTVIAALLATFTSQAFVLGAALWQDHQEVI